MAAAGPIARPRPVTAMPWCHHYFVSRLLRSFAAVGFVVFWLLASDKAKLVNDGPLAYPHGRLHLHRIPGSGRKCRLFPVL
jgi:hypothetical protein